MTPRKRCIDTIDSKGYKIYLESVLEKDDKIYLLAKKDLTKYLVSDDGNLRSQ